MKKYILLLLSISCFGQFNPVQWYNLGLLKTDLSGVSVSFQFENNFNDSSVNGINGSYVGTAKFLTGGKPNLAINKFFDEYVIIPDNALFNFPDNTPFSINFWFRKTDTALSGIISKREGSNFQWSVFQQNSLYTFRIYSDEFNYIESVYDASVSSSVWYNIGYSYDGSGVATGISIYVNGVKVNATYNTVGTYTGQISSSAPVRIGRNVSNSNGGIGVYDNINIWKNKILKHNDHLYLYNRGQGKAFPF